MRAIFDVMGVRNVVAKSHGSTNPYNMVRATLKALQELRTRPRLPPSAASRSRMSRAKAGDDKKDRHGHAGEERGRNPL